MAGYIGTQPVPQATQTRDSFTCTAGQTSFATGGYTPTFLDVYLNGIFLANGADYTASNGSDVILTAGAAAGDILEVVAYTTFEAAHVTGADDFTVTGSFTSQGIDDNATSTAMTLDSSGNVGIGTDSPVASLDVYTPAGTEAKLVVRNGTSTSPVASIELRRGATSETFGADAYGDYRLKNEGGNLSFDYGENGTTTEAMRIDSSGHMLVGKTSFDATTTGTIISSNGEIWATRSGSTPMYIRRLSSDGDLVQFNKDGSTVGSIGTLSSRMSIGTGDVGLFFNDQIDQIQPINTTTNAPRDNAISLGASDRRFKDLYLSGGVYLGGTGSANKLDDYEEGTWTPGVRGQTAAGTVTYQYRYGSYVKVGNRVIFDCMIYATNFTGTGDFEVFNLPFTSSGLGPVGMVNIQYNNCPFATRSADSQMVTGLVSGSTIHFRSSSRTQGASYTQMQCGSTTVGYLRLNGNYQVA